MDNYTIIIDYIHALVNEARNKEYLISKSDYIDVLNSLSKEDLDRFKSCLKDASLEDIKETLQRLNKKSLEMMSWRELKASAKEIGIINYSNLSKAELISSIKETQNERRKTYIINSDNAQG